MIRDRFRPKRQPRFAFYRATARSRNGFGVYHLCHAGMRFNVTPPSDQMPASYGFVEYSHRTSNATALADNQAR